MLNLIKTYLEEKVRSPEAWRLAGGYTTRAFVIQMTELGITIRSELKPNGDLVFQFYERVSFPVYRGSLCQPTLELIAGEVAAERILGKITILLTSEDQEVRDLGRYLHTHKDKI